jgi:hypothetical protein
MFLSSEVTNAIQEGYLDRAIREGIFPDLKFFNIAENGEYTGEYQEHTGTTTTFTKSGLISAKRKPKGGKDPNPSDVSREQMVCTLYDYSDSVDTNFVVNKVGLPGRMLNDAKTLSKGAAMTMEVLARSYLFRAYLSGRTNATAAGSSTTTLPVASINGFTHAMSGNKPVAVSLTNPLNITIGSTSAQVVAATPTATDDDGDSLEYGPGTLTLSEAKTWSDKDPVVADDAPSVVYASGDSIEDITTDKLTLAAINEAVASLRTNSVPTINGYYNCYLSPKGVQDLLDDADYKKLVSETFSEEEAAQGVLKKAHGVRFILHSLCPSYTILGNSSSVVDEIGGAVYNQGSKGIDTAIVMGAGALDKRYISPERIYGQMGQVQVGRWREMSAGLGSVINDVAFIVRPPLNRMMNKPALSWGWWGGFFCQTDYLSPRTGGARYKRACAIRFAA